MWRWVSKIHRTLHQVETMTRFYKVPHTESSGDSTVENLIYEGLDN